MTPVHNPQNVYSDNIPSGFRLLLETEKDFPHDALAVWTGSCWAVVFKREGKGISAEDWNRYTYITNTPLPSQEDFGLQIERAVTRIVRECLRSALEDVSFNVSIRLLIHQTLKEYLEKTASRR